MHVINSGTSINNFSKKPPVINGKETVKKVKGEKAVKVQICFSTPGSSKKAEKPICLDARQVPGTLHFEPKLLSDLVVKEIKETNSKPNAKEDSKITSKETEGIKRKLDQLLRNKIELGEINLPEYLKLQENKK